MCKSLCEALEPIKEVTKTICRNDANIVTAGAAVAFLLDELKNLGNVYSMQLHDAVKERISQRRQPTLVALAKYLLNPDTLAKVDPFSGSKIKKEALIKLAKQFIPKTFLHKCFKRESACTRRERD